MHNLVVYRPMKQNSTVSVSDKLQIYLKEIDYHILMLYYKDCLPNGKNHSTHR